MPPCKKAESSKPVESIKHKDKRANIPGPIGSDRGQTLTSLILASLQENLQENLGSDHSAPPFLSHRHLLPESQPIRYDPSAEGSE